MATTKKKPATGNTTGKTKKQDKTPAPGKWETDENGIQYFVPKDSEMPLSFYMDETKKKGQKGIRYI